MFTQQEANFLINLLSSQTLNPSHQDALSVVHMVQFILQKIKVDQLPPKEQEQEQKIETPE